MKHRAKNGDWSERKRIWRHPLAGERLFHLYRGYITIRKVWNQREHYEHIDPLKLYRPIACMMAEDMPWHEYIVIDCY
jgi:hypothetical protein